ncbi:MAG: SOS response-associated peptidase [Flavobacteriales bacterium]
MCFHIQQNKSLQEIEGQFKAKLLLKHSFMTGLFNGFEFPRTPIICNNQPEIIEMANWGLHPNWADENWNKTYTLNARMETLHEKPSFKSILNNRCIIISDGFFEWQHQGKIKTKYEIGFNNNLFAFAGLFDLRNGVKTYSIITTEAQGIMREIHNTKMRMPVAFKTAKSWNQWLEDGKAIPNFNFSYKNIDPIQLRLF